MRIDNGVCFGLCTLPLDELSQSIAHLNSVTLHSSCWEGALDRDKETENYKQTTQIEQHNKRTYAFTDDRNFFVDHSFYVFSHLLAYHSFLPESSLI